MDLWTKECFRAWLLKLCYAHHYWYANHWLLICRLILSGNVRKIKIFKKWIQHKPYIFANTQHFWKNYISTPLSASLSNFRFFIWISVKSENLYFRQPDSLRFCVLKNVFFFPETVQTNTMLSINNTHRFTQHKRM